MWFLVVAGGTLAVILGAAAVIDWRTRRSGRSPRRAYETSALIRDARRQRSQRRFGGTRAPTRSRDDGPPYGTPPSAR